MTTPDARDEMVRQFQLLWDERWARLGTSTIAYAVCAIYLPFWIPLICAIVNWSIEAYTMRLMRSLDPAKDPRRHRQLAFLVFVMEIAYCIPPGLIWMEPAPYAQGFAVGMILMTMLQVAMARALDLMTGLAGFAGLAITSLTLNSISWINQGDYVGLAISTLCAFAALTYGLATLFSNHRIHLESAIARSDAMAADRAKSRFLAQMSHELRTPLNAILGMGHAELRRNHDRVSQQRLSVLLSAGEGLSTILDDILDLSAIEDQRMPIRPVAVFPTEEIQATLSLFRPGVEETGLGLVIDLAPELDTPALLDPQRLRQCLSNLLSNALKHTTEGEIRITARPIAASGSTEKILQIDVADTGPGIPEHLHETIFQPFSQSPDLPQAVASAAMPQGRRMSNGLGLSISRALARQMGGDLVVKSARTGGDTLTGTVFRLTVKLPEAPKDALPTPRHARPLQTPQPTTEGLTGLRALVVDDIQTNRLVASTYLRMLGAQPSEAQSGEEALNILATGGIDLVLLDMNMPGMDGCETLRRIRQLPDPQRQVPVLAMTADALADHREQYLASGVDGYLSKPLHPNRMEAEINAVLRAKGSDVS